MTTGLIWLVAGLLLEAPLTSAYFEFCYDSKPYRVKFSDCEGGLLFKEPIQVGCTYPKEQEFTIDVCSGEKYSHESTGAVDRPKFQYVQMLNDDTVVEPSEEPYKSESCHKTCEGEFFQFDASSAAPPEVADVLPYTASEERENMIDGVVNDDKHVKDQTERLFLYLSGLLVDEGENGPNTRLAKIMRMSFEIFRTHCPTEFVSRKFGEQLEKSFFYLLREGDLGRMKDISEEDYEKIKSGLDNCQHQKPTPFVLEGNVCSSKAIVQNISSTVIDMTVRYSRTMDSFRWGKYDVPVDAAWAVGDFVHGLCYGKFSQNVNKHHQYEVAMESLFTAELMYRWQRPFKLGFPEAWDHLLQADMRDTMRNVDACVQGSYLGSPFLRRLQRPIMSVAEAGRKRKRRDTSEDYSENPEWAGKVFCLSSQKEATETIESLKKDCSSASQDSGSEGGNF